MQLLANEEPPGRYGDFTADFEQSTRSTQKFGVGLALRQRFADWSYGKLSYEWATRLPRPSEYFGDSAFILESLNLLPERSHNLNLSLVLDGPDTASGSFQASALFFLRETENLILQVRM